MRDDRLAVELGDRREVELDAFAGRERPHHEVAEALDLFEIDDTLLEQLEHGEEAHDDLELLGRAEREVAEAHRAAWSGSSARTVSIASRTLARIGATWSVCTSATASGTSPARAAARNASSETRSSGSGASERNGSSGPGAAGDRAARVGEALVQHLRRVLERLALEEPREQQVALLEARQLLVEIDVFAARQQPAGLQLDQRRRDQQELGRDSRSTRSMRSTSAQNASTMRTSEISQRSTSSLRMRCRRRSNGPSKTGVETSYGMRSGYPTRSRS